MPVTQHVHCLEGGTKAVCPLPIIIRAVYTSMARMSWLVPNYPHERRLTRYMRCHLRLSRFSRHITLIARVSSGFIGGSPFHPSR
jgi:hypothetical protein